MDIVIAELKKIALGILLCDGVFLLVSLGFGFFSAELFSGMALGTAYAIIHFLLLGTSVASAMKKNPRQAQIQMTVQYFIRMILTAFVILIGFAVDFINPLGVVVPLFFPKIVLYAQSIFRKGANR